MGSTFIFVLCLIQKVFNADTHSARSAIPLVLVFPVQSRIYEF